MITEIMTTFKLSVVIIWVSLEIFSTIPFHAPADR